MYTYILYLSIYKCPLNFHRCYAPANVPDAVAKPVSIATKLSAEFSAEQRATGGRVCCSTDPGSPRLPGEAGGNAAH